MARIRTIKPEFWTDDAVTECSLTARLLFIGLWNFADDNGNIERSSKQMKMKIFPADSLETEPLVVELIQRGLLIEYEYESCKYLHIKGFEKHQVINKKSKTGNPKYEDSRRTTTPLPNYSHMEGKGREGKGKELTTTPSSVREKMKAVLIEKRPDLQKLFPDLDIDVVGEKLLNHYQGKNLPIDIYATILKWFQFEFKTIQTPRTGKEGGRSSLEVKTSSNPDYWSEGAVT